MFKELARKLKILIEKNSYTTNRINKNETAG